MKGWIKNLVNVFRLYKNPFLSLDDRFIKPDLKSIQWYKRYSASLKDSSMKGFFKYLQCVSFVKMYPVQCNIIYFLEAFTNDDYSNDQIEEFKNTTIKTKDYPFNAAKQRVKDIQLKRRDVALVKLKDREIVAKRLSYCLEGVDYIFPTIEGSERYGKCHSMSMMLSMSLDIPSFVVTGITYYASSKEHYLHSWVELETDDKQYCLDVTKNLVLEKKDYYYLLHIKPYEKISSQQLFEDQEIIETFANIEKDHYLKLYLSSRQEMLEKIDLIEKE